jgi:hypothetical protein
MEGTMKSFFRLTAAVLLVVSMLFASFPGIGLSAEEKITVAEMETIKKAADDAAEASKNQLKEILRSGKETQVELCNNLAKSAMINAAAAEKLLENLRAGKAINRKQAQACSAITQAVNKAVKALAADDVKQVEGLLAKIAQMMDSISACAINIVEMEATKKAADEALGAARVQWNQAVESSKEKQIELAQELLENAMINAAAAEKLLEDLRAGKIVDCEQVEACVAITQAVNKTVKALVAGDVKEAEGLIFDMAGTMEKLLMVEIGDKGIQSFKRLKNQQISTALDEPRKCLTDGKAYCNGNSIYCSDGKFFASCKDKICVNNPYGAHCEPCPPGQKVKNGKCEPKCTQDKHCGKCEICNNGTCTKKFCPPPPASPVKPPIDPCCP